LGGGWQCYGERPGGRKLKKSSKGRFTAEWGGSTTGLVKGNGLSAALGYLDNTPKWGDIQICLITCWATSRTIK
jgi:hypothetical protein